MGRDPSKPHYRRVRSENTLWHAWQAIRENGRASRLEETRNQIRQFDQSAISRIKSISARLSHRSYEFEPAKGIAKNRPGKSPRPIVMAPVENRIVQRAILDVIQSDDVLAPLTQTPYSFGGIPGRGVQHAVEAALDKIQNFGATYYICSDISGFFTGIRREEVVQAVRDHVPDPDFVSLFDQALTTELSNMAALKEQASLFPIYEIGVAQGCCLSPLVGNIYLRDFDRALNSQDVFCLRYIDDFLVLGKDEKAVRAKFKQGVRMLKALGLDAYDPDDGSGKAHQGDPRKGFDYLGCTIRMNSIRPSTTSWDRLHSSIKGSFSLALHTAETTKSDLALRPTFAATVSSCSRRLEGWVKQYGFCTDSKVIKDWNNSIQMNFVEFENSFTKIIRNRSHAERARLLGLCDISEAYQAQRDRITRKRIKM